MAVCHSHRGASHGPLVPTLRSNRRSIRRRWPANTCAVSAADPPPREHLHDAVVDHDQVRTAHLDIGLEPPVVTGRARTRPLDQGTTATHRRRTSPPTPVDGDRHVAVGFDPRARRTSTMGDGRRRATGREPPRVEPSRRGHRRAARGGRPTAPACADAQLFTHAMPTTSSRGCPVEGLPGVAVGPVVESLRRPARREHTIGEVADQHDGAAVPVTPPVDRLMTSSQSAVGTAGARDRGTPNCRCRRAPRDRAVNVPIGDQCTQVVGGDRTRGDRAKVTTMHHRAVRQAAHLGVAEVGDRHRG